MLYRSWASLAGRSAAGRRQASTFKIVTLPGDGVGPEVTEQSMKVLRAIAAKGGVSFDFEEHLIGGAAIDATGSALPDETLEACVKTFRLRYSRDLLVLILKQPSNVRKGLLKSGSFEALVKSTKHFESEAVRT